MKKTCEVPAVDARCSTTLRLTLIRSGGRCDDAASRPSFERGRIGVDVMCKSIVIVGLVVRVVSSGASLRAEAFAK